MSCPWGEVCAVCLGSHDSSVTSSPGFTGPLCEENIDNSDPDPCHHGQCQDGVDSYTCICKPGYMGAICSDQIDECYSRPCLNDGRCIDLVNGYQCNCQPGTSGECGGCVLGVSPLPDTAPTDASASLDIC